MNRNEDDGLVAGGTFAKINDTAGTQTSVPGIEVNNTGENANQTENVESTLVRDTRDE